MSRLSRLTPRDLEALSAYADGALSPAERLAVERRLEQEPALREALRELRATSALLHGLPQVRPPHNFTLSPEMAGVRSGWLRTPFLQLATAVAMLALVVTVGVDVFGSMLPSAALRAAAPAQELAVEAPSEFAAEDALEAGAVPALGETAAAEKAAVEETAVVAAAPAAVLAATPTAAVQAEEYANREAPTVGGAAIAPVPSESAIATPRLEAQPTTRLECEACSAELELPTAALQDMAAVTAVPEGESATEEVAGQVTEPPAEAIVESPAPEARLRGGLPALRWVEIGLGAIALMLGTITLWARRRAR
jgi:anti-sigma factor RsiW